MGCGEKRLVYKKVWKTCYRKFNYWCGFTHKWCKGWFGVKYPCKFKSKYCKGSIPYPCYTLTEVEQYCYDFFTIHSSCYVGIEMHVGCCDGREYSWRDVCLGWYDAQQDSKTLCFDERLNKVADECREGHSLPAGKTPFGPSGDTGDSGGDDDYPTGPFDPPPGGGLTNNKGIMNIKKGHFLISSQIRNKLGRCKRCMLISFKAAVISTASYLGLSIFAPTSLLTGFILIPTIALNILAVTHMIAFHKRRFGMSYLKDETECGCQ